MRIIRRKEFIAERPWGAMDIANMNGITTRLHWTDTAYKWHINDGEEVFVVLHGQVEMHYVQQGENNPACLMPVIFSMPASVLSMSRTLLAKHAYW